jgi:hypothetical protein
MASAPPPSPGTVRAGGGFAASSFPAPRMRELALRPSLEEFRRTSKPDVSSPKAADGGGGTGQGTEHERKERWRVQT